MNQILRINNISAKTRTLVFEVIPLINQLPVQDIAVDFLITELLRLCDGIILTDDITLTQLTQNLYEFLDTVNALILRLKDAHMLTIEKFSAMKNNIDDLITQLPKHQNFISDDFLQKKRTDEEFTEPVFQLSKFRFRF